MAIFKGAGVAIVTPMKSNGEVNYEKFADMIEYQIANGTDAIIVCGTTGESSTLTHEEHLDVIKYCTEKVAGRIPVVAGTGSNCTETAVYLSQEAEKYGVTLTEISDPNSKNSADKAISTDSLYFDVAMITLMHVYPMAQRHFFYDYHDLEAVDLSEPWWDQNAVNDLSVCGKLYFCTGSFDTTRFDSIRCLAFNKDLLTSLGLESPYTLVDENRWTIDKFIEMGQAAQIDYGEDSRFTDEDTYGLAS